MNSATDVISLLHLAEERCAEGITEKSDKNFRITFAFMFGMETSVKRMKRRKGIGN